jgi:hypothetical protein
MFAHQWLGREAMYLDAPHLTLCGDMLIGCYGGNRRAGANKNEDGAFALCAEDMSWHFAALCDAHVSSQSAELVLRALAGEQSAIVAALSHPTQSAFPALHELIVNLLRSADFRAQCQTVTGETACLLCAQKEQWLWWLSIGDCLLYLLHPELARLGQLTLNQRNFYEWVGKVNTFDSPVPAFATGVCALRQGWNCVLMVTDGMLECGTRPFEHSRLLYDVVMGEGDVEPFEMHRRIGSVLARVHEEVGRDSATVIQWGIENALSSVYPSG